MPIRTSGIQKSPGGGATSEPALMKGARIVNTPGEYVNRAVGSPPVTLTYNRVIFDAGGYVAGPGGARRLAAPRAGRYRVRAEAEVNLYSGTSVNVYLWVYRLRAGAETIVAAARGIVLYAGGRFRQVIAEATVDAEAGDEFEVRVGDLNSVPGSAWNVSNAWNDTDLVNNREELIGSAEILDLTVG